MRRLAATIVVPVLLFVSATLVALHRTDSAVLPLVAAVPAHAMEQNASNGGCPPGQPAAPQPGPGFVPTQDCQGWVPANHPAARGAAGAPSASSAPGSFGCPAGMPATPSPGDTFVPTQDCTGWVPRDHPSARHISTFDDVIASTKDALFEQGKQIFRFDTFGDEAFWGDTLRLHQAIAGQANGGVGPGLSPAQALALGLKVDVNAVPAPVLAALRGGRLDLTNPANTIALLKANAVVGLTVFQNDSGAIRSMGIQCALCHSTVDDSLAPGIGNRLDGWANRDLDVGAIIALAPNLQPLVDLLGVSDATVRSVLRSWGPGKFDAELILDGKAVNPQQVSHGVVTGTNVPAATLIPPAYGLAGINLHTWTGWGSIPHWNAFVANLEMHGIGSFFDPRLNDAAQFPIAARNGFGNIVRDPDADLITPKLPALHHYQVSIPAPAPPAGSFDPAAAARGDEVFNGAGRCGSCHREPLFTEPGWNLHAGAEIGIDNFQADRAPDHKYRTSPLKGLFAHQKGGFFHDGRFATLLQVVQHYNLALNLNLTTQQMNDLVEYLKSL
jgi:hypothetical protein